MLRVADGVSQFDFREIVGVEALNVALVGAGHRLLRLHDFQVVRHPGGKAILRLSERLFRQIDGTAGDFHLFGGSIQIEQRGTDLIVDPATKISQLRTHLFQLRVRFEHVAVNPIPSEDWDIYAADHLPGAIRLGRSDADVAKIRSRRRRWDNALPSLPAGKVLPPGPGRPPPGSRRARRTRVADRFRAARGVNA